MSLLARDSPLFRCCEVLNFVSTALDEKATLFFCFDVDGLLDPFSASCSGFRDEDEVLVIEGSFFFLLDADLPVLEILAIEIADCA